tara:strand:+ start:360 stop:1178 length:819 start_codon:yes stop_codon:yes gene_type:complete
MVKKRNKRTRKKYKRGGMEYLTNDQIKDLINESYENSKVMLESFNDNNNNSIVNELKDLLNFYFDLHNSIQNPSRKVLEHSLEVLHSFGSKKQAIAGGRAVDQILLNAMQKDIFFKELDNENQKKVLIKIDDLSGGFSDKQLDDCNERLLAQGIKGMIKRRKQCIETDAKAGLNTQPIEEPKKSSNYLFTDAEIKTMDNFLYGNKSGVECSELSNTKCKKSDNCDLVTKKIKGNSNNKKNKVKTCLPKTKGGKRTKRKKSRKKRKKSRKRRR